MSKTIGQVFDELPYGIEQEVYRIVGWSVEHNKIHPVIEQYTSGKNIHTLMASNDWCWFGKLTEEQKICIAAIVKQAAGDRDEYCYGPCG